MACWKYAVAAALLGLAGCGSDDGTPAPAPFSDAAVVKPDGSGEPTWPDGGWPEAALPVTDGAGAALPDAAVVDAAASDGALDATADLAEAGD